jgi:uncharacterized tellurite resistance protein B-like protein
MFMHLLDQPQRRELVRAARFLARADGVVDLREEEILERMRIEVGFEADDLPEPPARVVDLLDALEPAFEEPSARRVLLIELLRLVVADGSVEDEELEVVAGICRRLELDTATYRACRGVARRLRDVEAEGHAVIDAEAPADDGDLSA